MSKTEKIFGSNTKPRICVLRSNKYISAQLIDDENGVTILSMNSKKIDKKSTPVEKAFETGKALGEAAKAKKVTEAVFDRGTYRYHGRVKSLADGIREAGIKF